MWSQERIPQSSATAAWLPNIIGVADFACPLCYSAPDPTARGSVSTAQMGGTDRSSGLAVVSTVCFLRQLDLGFSAGWGGGPSEHRSPLNCLVLHTTHAGQNAKQLSASVESSMVAHLTEVRALAWRAEFNWESELFVHPP